VEAAFRERGIRGLGEAVPSYLESRWTRCLFWGSVNLIVPIFPILRWGVEFDQKLETSGLLGASRSVLEGLGLRPRILLPEGARDTLRTASLLVYGNHPSLADPFLVALALARPDLKMLSASYLSLLLPSLGPHLIAVQPTFERKPLHLQGASHYLLVRLLYRAEGMPDPAVAREANRRALEEAAAHAAEGGALLIAPGSRSAKGRWLPGIGVIATHLARLGREVWLAPYGIRRVTNARIYRGISKRPLARIGNALFHRRPAEITFAEPVPISTIVSDASESPSRVTARLNEHYQTLFRTRGLDKT
jgi:hypothetical protein